MAAWHEEQQAAEEHERLFGELPATGGGEPGQDEDCDELVEAFRDGAEELLSEARFDRVRNR